MNVRERILTELSVKPGIVPEAEIRRRVDFLRDYLKSTPAKAMCSQSAAAKTVR
jgi:NAD+ synthase